MTLSSLASRGVLANLAESQVPRGGTDPLKTGCLFWYQLEEASGARADASGNGRTLTEVGTITNQAGVIGNGTFFDVDSTGTYLWRAYEAGLFCATQFSVSFWVKSTAADATQRPIMTRGRSNANSYNWSAYRNAQGGGLDSWALFMVNGTVSGTTALLTTIGAWTHVVWIYDGTQPTDATRLVCYVNNVQRSLTIPVAIPTSLADNVLFNLYLHMRRPASTNAWRTGLDLAGMWSWPLTLANVGTLYGGGAGYTPF